MSAWRQLGRAYQTAALGFLIYKLGTLSVNALAFPVLRPRPPLPAAPRVSILVPARDEALNLPHTLPRLLAQIGGIQNGGAQSAVEVLILDDASSDDTARIAADLCAGLAGARVLSGLPRPPGWHGKPWACMQLGRAAAGDVLIFTDADVCWEAGTLNALLHALEHSGADLLTVWPRQETRTPGERLLAPLVDDVLLSILPVPITALPFASMSAGNGQLMAFRRASYHKVGGHALVRGEVLEDVSFAARLKARGGRVALALGGDLMSVRMYRHYAGPGGAVEGFAKSLHAVHGGSRSVMAASWLWHFGVYTLPWLPVFGGRVRPLLMLLGLLERLLVNLKTGRTRRADLLEVLLTPFTPLAALPVYLLAWQPAYRWKGREYTRAKERA
ncbi:glycosyltransferase [Deinococcus altitudinis]|uniref:glycosyltransferase n=1 Tax=Deinococcus altitudinis TaxID=468914 RepID=UPI003892B5CC